jgi:hypothetical protein
MADGKGLLKDELSNDGLHPNSRGYQVMAPLAEKAITSALKKNRKSTCWRAFASRIGPEGVDLLKCPIYSIDSHSFESWSNVVVRLLCVDEKQQAPRPSIQEGSGLDFIGL